MIGFDETFRRQAQFENKKAQGHLFKQIENVRNAIAHCGSLVVVFGNPQSLNLFMGKVKSMIAVVNGLNEEVAYRQITSRGGVMGESNQA